METVKLTTAQALVRFLDQQYIEVDGRIIKYIDGISVVFGHGIVLGLGEALLNESHMLNVYQGKNEQGQAHMAIGFAKQNLRRRIIAVSSSIGPGSANMVTAAATATANNIPLLLLPADTFASRQPDPVLQQIEQFNDPSITTNDVFRPVCKYFDRIIRPEMLMSSMVQAIQTLVNPVTCGAVTIALPQDVQGESYDYPISFFKKRIYKIPRTIPDKEDINQLVKILNYSEHPLIICGGGVKYSDAGEELMQLSRLRNIPLAETQAGKSTIPSSYEMNLGGIGVTGNLAANHYAKQADLIIGIGTRMTDFTTGSKELFAETKICQINVSDYHAMKLDAMPVVADAKVALKALLERAEEIKVFSEEAIAVSKSMWDREYDRLTAGVADPQMEIDNEYTQQFEEFKSLTSSTLTQVRAIRLINEHVEPDAVIVAASGSLPGDLQRLWKTDSKNSYSVEYGYSCMGYEVAASLGCKIAESKREVYVMVGDAAFIMLHSELLTSLQEHKKINICVFDNMSNGCISNLQMSNGLDSFCTDFRYRNPEANRLNGSYLKVDFSKIGEGYGLKTFHVTDEEELLKALDESKKSSISTLIDIKVLPKTMSNGYESWWNVGLASISTSRKVNKAYAELQEHRKKARKY